VETSPLAISVGWLVGIGPGRGMALLFIIGGIMAAGVCLTGFFIPTLRRAEDLLPDHDTVTAAAEDERISHLQELLELRQQLVTQPYSVERDLALKAISNDLKRLGAAKE